MVGALAHSVGYADVNEPSPSRCGANHVEDRLAGLSLLVDVIQLRHVLFSVADVPQVSEPSVEYVSKVIVFANGIPPDGASHCVVAVGVKCVVAGACLVPVLAGRVSCGLWCVRPVTQSSEVVCAR